uniref:Uncharacterized protein n=1 Tax=Coccidioides posadasii RMSCC 3488 TaxID=454284 RepID=A0A0J6FKB9_COCPO|nr:hypothetical protein CPAG_07079 [Coccidioides posadasii RMSCC 3488]
MKWVKSAFFPPSFSRFLGISLADLSPRGNRAAANRPPFSTAQTVSVSFRPVCPPPSLPSGSPSPILIISIPSKALRRLIPVVYSPFHPPSLFVAQKFGLTTTCCGIGVLPQRTTTERFLHRPRSRIISVAFLPGPPSDPVCIRPPLGANSSPSIPQDPRSYPKFYFNYWILSRHSQKFISPCDLSAGIARFAICLTLKFEQLLSRISSRNLLPTSLSV